MAILDALYQQDPMWIWLSLGALFLALNLATGSSLLMWPAAAAALVAALELVGLRLGLAMEAALFAGLSLAAFAAILVRMPRAAQVAAAAPAPSAAPSGAASGRQAQTGRLVGRIGRATRDFANGVGRVYIDGAEWAAEIDHGEVDVPEGAPVRVSKVMGGVRLMVHPLSAG